MIIEIAKNAGFCSGVKSAFELAIELAAKHEKVYTIGELVHNEQVTKFLMQRGVVALPLDKMDTLKSGDIAIIRAHGIPQQLEVELKSRGVLVFDATCPVVKNIHKIVCQRRELGDEIIIVGDCNHDEVVGTASYAGDSVRIFSDSEEIEISNKPTAIVFQTTILTEKFAKVQQNIESFQKIHGNTVGIFNTICYTTKARQDEACDLASKSDAVLVLGSRKSANTIRLFQVAKKNNPNTFFAETVAETLVIKNKDFQWISIVAGASTPPWLIQEVTEHMSETQLNAVETAPETEVKEAATLQEQKPVTENAPERELTMEDVMASNRSVGYTNYKVGKRIKGTVIRAEEAGIYIAVGGKKDGFIDKADATLDGNYNSADYAAGDSIEAVITSVNKDYVALSKKEIDAIRFEEAESEKALSADEFSLVMSEVVKGGLRGRLGAYTVFVPASQIKMGYVKNLEDYKGKTLRLTLMPAKEKEAQEGDEAIEIVEDKPVRKSKYLFASQRMILEKEKQEKENLFWDNIHVHDIVIGKVKRFTAFGAFVNVRGFDCLAHISELSWNKITEPSAVLTIGESYDFVVLKMDRETGKISLGFKQLQKKPYEVAAETYPIGTIIKGKVERIFPYGAFISISEGVDGLVHVSQISHNWIKDANEALTIGQEVDAKIIGFEENRITLSIKELLPVPEESEAVAETENFDSTDDTKRPSRVKKFEQKLAEGEVKRDRRPRRESNNEPKEWVTGSSNATLGDLSILGDLFKNLNFDLAEEKVEEAVVESVVEAPKKATRKKKVVEEVVATEETAKSEEVVATEATAVVEEAPKKATRKKKVVEEVVATDAE